MVAVAILLTGFFILLANHTDSNEVACKAAMVKELQSTETKTWMLNPTPEPYTEPKACYGLSTKTLIKLANQAALQVYSQQ